MILVEGLLLTSQVKDAGHNFDFFTSQVVNAVLDDILGSQVTDVDSVIGHSMIGLLVHSYFTSGKYFKRPVANTNRTPPDAWCNTWKFCSYASGQISIILNLVQF